MQAWTRVAIIHHVVGTFRAAGISCNDYTQSGFYNCHINLNASMKLRDIEKMIDLQKAIEEELDLNGHNEEDADGGQSFEDHRIKEDAHKEQCQDEELIESKGIQLESSPKSHSKNPAKSKHSPRTTRRIKLDSPQMMSTKKININQIQWSHVESWKYNMAPKPIKQLTLAEMVPKKKAQSKSPKKSPKPMEKAKGPGLNEPITDESFLE
jgi:hypothetical protein